MSVQDFYDDMYRHDKPNKPRFSLYTSVLNRMLARFGVDRYRLTYQLLPGGDSVLDVGCGEDLTLMPLRSKYREVYGIDISKTRIERMQERFGHDPGIHLSVGDVNSRLSFADASFDAIIAIAILEHIFDPYHFMRECYRLLKTGGCLIVYVPNVAVLGNRIRLLMGKFPVTSNEEGWDGGHLHYFTRASLKKLFLDDGFKVAKITSGGILATLGRPWSLLSPLLDGDIIMVGIKE